MGASFPSSTVDTANEDAADRPEDLPKPDRLQKRKYPVNRAARRTKDQMKQDKAEANQQREEKRARKASNDLAVAQRKKDREDNKAAKESEKDLKMHRWMDKLDRARMSEGQPAEGAEFRSPSM